MTNENLTPGFAGLRWTGSAKQLISAENGLRDALLNLETPIWAVQAPQEIQFASQGSFHPSNNGGLPVLAYSAALPLTSMGDTSFCSDYGTRYALYCGAMANAISSVEMVITLGKAGLLGSFGAAGLSPARVEEAIQKIQAALPRGPYAFNLINSPFEPAIAERLAALYIQHEVPVVEASAYLDITYPLAWYRASGLSRLPDGSLKIGHRVIGKLSRKEVAKRFMEPIPADLLAKLQQDGRITAEQAQLAARVPVADDITVEADSGGHTDNRPLVGLLPAILNLRDQIQSKNGYTQPIRVGAAGGISTPASALAAFMMGAAYVATGSVNQACLESGASEYTRRLLANADMADVIMAPAADMFEMGVRVQVLKRGTMFAVRALKLAEIYSDYNSIDEIPPLEREKLEKTIFKRALEDIWQDTVKFFQERDPRQIERAQQDPHQKMALIFRWYLGLSSRWSVMGDPERTMDYQIWCGPSMGAFNDWVRGTYLEDPANRHMVDVSLHILTGAAYLARLRSLTIQGLHLPAGLERYSPDRPLV